MTEFEFATMVLVLCLLVLLGLFALYFGDCLVEYQKLRLLRESAQQVKEQVASELHESYENLASWMSEAERLRMELDSLKAELLETQQALNNRFRPVRDTHGRFAKKEV